MDIQAQIESTSSGGRLTEMREDQFSEPATAMLRDYVEALHPPIVTTVEIAPFRNHGGAGHWLVRGVLNDPIACTRGNHERCTDTPPDRIGIRGDPLRFLCFANSKGNQSFDILRA